MRQSRRRISLRHILSFCECGRHFDLEISAGLSATGGRTFHRAPFCALDWRIFARARSRVFVALSIFVALVASLNGWIICWGASDWFGALGAFTWLPWAWWGTERAINSGDQMAVSLALALRVLLVTGGFPYTVLMLLLLIVWLSAKSLVRLETFSRFCRCSSASRSVLGFPHRHGWRFLIWFRVRRANSSRR